MRAAHGRMMSEAPSSVEAATSTYSRSGMRTVFFLVKGQMLNMSDFGGQGVSDATAQPCCCRVEAP